MSDPQEAATPSDPHSAEALDLDAIQKRADSATEGPWEWTGTDFESGEERLEATSVRRISHGYDLAESVLDAGGMHTEGFLYLERTDAEFIAHVRTDVPALVAAVRSRDAEVAELKAKIAEIRGDAHLTQMTPNPNDTGAYVLGRNAEAALFGSASSPVEGGEQQ